MLLLVTGSHLVSGYLTLQRHWRIVNSESRPAQPELAPGLEQVLCLLSAPSRGSEFISLQLVFAPARNSCPARSKL